VNALRQDHDPSPAAFDPRFFRDVLAHLPTGVTVITAYAEHGPTGMAANSLTSVSLDPPLVLFCAAKTSTTWPKIRAAGTFCVNILAGHHEPLSRQFSAPEIDRFAGVDYSDRPAGPALADAIAWIECEPRDEHEAGDHTIVVGRVTAMAVATTELEPLVFFRGRYGSFQAS
jgi:flavin reductase (DIM6/NTAB) family NADH-FMN oxidoreductase RutF